MASRLDARLKFWREKRKRLLSQQGRALDHDYHDNFGFESLAEEVRKASSMIEWLEKRKKGVSGSSGISEFTVLYENGQTEHFIVVPIFGVIEPYEVSAESPIARAVMSGRIGEKVLVRAPVPYEVKIIDAR